MPTDNYVQEARAIDDAARLHLITILGALRSDGDLIRRKRRARRKKVVHARDGQEVSEIEGNREESQEGDKTASAKN